MLKVSPTHLPFIILKMRSSVWTVWRTSTPEPSRGDGIIWTYIKDVTRYIPLFAKPGTFILQLDNLIQPGLDGIYSSEHLFPLGELSIKITLQATVHATFYASSPRVHPAAKKADLIIPLSTFANNTGNDASVPPGFSVYILWEYHSSRGFKKILAQHNSTAKFRGCVCRALRLWKRQRGILGEHSLVQYPSFRLSLSRAHV